MINFSKKMYSKLYNIMVLIGVLLVSFILFGSAFNHLGLGDIIIELWVIYLIILIGYLGTSGVINKNVYPKETNNKICLALWILGIITVIMYIVGIKVSNIYIIINIAANVYLDHKNKKNERINLQNKNSKINNYYSSDTWRRLLFSLERRRNRGADSSYFLAFILKLIRFYSYNIDFPEATLPAILP